MYLLQQAYEIGANDYYSESDSNYSNNESEKKRKKNKKKKHNGELSNEVICL